MSERGYGIVGTLIVHNIILLILLFSFLVLPNESASEGALIINFGDMETAGGLIEPELNDMPFSEPASAASQRDNQTQDEGILTQDFEEAPAVNQSSTNNVSKETDIQENVSESTVQEKPAEQTQQVDTRALYSNRGASATESGTSEGIYQGSGNMGNPQGTPESDNYDAGLTGSSIGFDLSGRNPLFLQKPEFSVYTEGDIVVEITVDRNGNVISATPGIKGSTIVDNTLYAAVLKAALASRFSIRNDAPERQVGTITYHFQLQ